MEKVIELNEYKENKELLQSILWKIEYLEFENEDLKEELYLKEIEAKKNSDLKCLIELKSLNDVLKNNLCIIDRMKKIINKYI
ncbi:hypothetical protein [Clostridioides difficile]|uniref:hypothetical protein n=1 Tax=Clostridioides difficile TaxID=1496 RepID=UPI003F8D38EB